METRVKKVSKVKVEFEVDVEIDGIEVQTLVGWHIKDALGNWTVVRYGDGAEKVGARYGDCVEKEIENIVIDGVLKEGDG